MSVTIPIQAIELTPGSHISIHNITWQDFEEILTNLGEKRNTRVAYHQGILEIHRFSLHLQYALIVQN